MVLRVEVGRQQRAVLRLRALALTQHVGAQAAGQLGLVLDGAVLRRSARDSAPVYVLERPTSFRECLLPAEWCCIQRKQPQLNCSLMLSLPISLLMRLNNVTLQNPPPKPAGQSLLTPLPDI